MHSEQFLDQTPIRGPVWSITPKLYRPFAPTTIYSPFNTCCAIVWSWSALDFSPPRTDLRRNEASANPSIAAIIYARIRIIRLFAALPRFCGVHRRVNVVIAEAQTAIPGCNANLRLEPICACMLFDGPLCALSPCCRPSAFGHFLPRVSRQLVERLQTTALVLRSLTSGAIRHAHPSAQTATWLASLGR